MGGRMVLILLYGENISDPSLTAKSVDPDNVESTLPLGSTMLRSGDPACSIIPGSSDSNPVSVISSPVSAISSLVSLAVSSSLFLPASRILLFCDSVKPRVRQWPSATLFSNFLWRLRYFLRERERERER